MRMEKEETTEQAALIVCEFCGALNAVIVETIRICDTCYSEHGSCCAGDEE